MLINQKGKEQIKEENIFVKPNFVQRPSVKSSLKKEQYLYIGRLERLKGIHVLLEAWREIPEKKLLICGSGPEEEWARAYVEKHCMNQVVLMGQCQREKVLQLLAESRALIVPSICYEGQPMVILESFAVGTPVIASNLGNAGDMIETNVTGLTFAYGEAEALIQAVEQAEKQSTWNTREVYEKNYSAEENYAILRRIYRKVQKESK